MKPESRALAGLLSGAGATVALSLLREASRRAGLMSDTAPKQVLERAEELGLLEDYSESRDVMLTLAAHYGYGMTSGAAFGLLRSEVHGVAEEAAVGAALGMLAWAAGWAIWLPASGVHSAPWNQTTPKVLLPVLDHAVFGATWGFLYFIMCEDELE